MTYNDNDNRIEESSSIQLFWNSKNLKRSLVCHDLVNGLVAVAVFFALVLFAVIGIKLATLKIKNSEILTCENADEGNNEGICLIYGYLWG